MKYGPQAVSESERQLASSMMIFAIGFLCLSGDKTPTCLLATQFEKTKLLAWCRTFSRFFVTEEELGRSEKFSYFPRDYLINI